ncbi:plexin domain-containing protein 2-like [Pocillopora damicornis]|uniref:plexin domain-containing protein 2-like n=1 Tax=Pocillopora damicornis TaxID=46731 RepID=UPI000F54DFC4|nr:plexin domain-containing protein 2-like [Pocillopora damicornis]
MNRAALTLIFGVLLSCFYLECKALQYQDSRHNFLSSLLETDNTLDLIRHDHHRSRRNLGGVLTNGSKDCEQPEKNLNCSEVEVHHKYYVSQIINSGKDYWVDVQGNPDHEEHYKLSDSYLLRKPYPLKFKFPYYGHLLDSVVLTTGGFLYMDVHDTRLMTQVQYLAPLMAYFNPHLDKDSKVLTLHDESKLTVQWNQVHLHNNKSAGPFTFQCTLHKNGTIWFAYQAIPVDVAKIPHLPYHPVRVGIADAFVIEVKRGQVRYRYFYIYSTINITMEKVGNNVAVIIKPQLSCVSAQSCSLCMKRTEQSNFTCQWCPELNRCSDGVDRHRADWDAKNCPKNAVKELTKECKANTIGTTGSRRSHEKKGIGAGAIVAICFVLVLIIGVAAWCMYAYRYPTSKSGLFLIEASRRPRELFKSRSDGGNTSHAAPSDVKPQVL